MRAPGPWQLFGLFRCRAAATQALSRPRRPREDRSAAAHFASGITCSRGDSEDTRGGVRCSGSLSGHHQPTPPLSLRDISPRKGGERGFGSFAKAFDKRGYEGAASANSTPFAVLLKSRSWLLGCPIPRIWRLILLCVRTIAWPCRSRSRGCGRASSDRCERGLRCSSGDSVRVRV